MRFLAGAMLGLALAVLFAGCPRKGPAGPLGPVVIHGPSPTDGGPGAAASVAPFKWTDTPTIEMIPDKPIKGVVHGQPFVAGCVLIVPDSDGKITHIEISDQQLESEDQFLMDDTRITLCLPRPVAPGVTFTKGLDEKKELCDASYEYPKEQVQDTVEADWAGAVSIGEGQDEGYKADGDMVQVTGEFKGKLALCFKDKDAKGFAENSWIAGSFEAKVRYLGAPPNVSPAPTDPGKTP